MRYIYINVYIILQYNIILYTWDDDNIKNDEVTPPARTSHLYVYVQCLFVCLRMSSSRWCQRQWCKYTILVGSKDYDFKMVKAGNSRIRRRVQKSSPVRVR